VRLRVGAFATTQLPGVGVVLNQQNGGRLGLVPGTGLLLAVPRADPAVVAAEIQHALGNGVVVESVLSDVVPSAGWVPPAIGPITSPFGMRIHPITHLPEFHDGIDIGAPLGAPVYAMSAGQVLYAGPASGFGSEIVLSHPGGVSTVYGHLSQIFTMSGPVKTGQVIGLVGNEGESTGPHLHAEVHVQDQPVDPVAWLEQHGVRFTR
jgi:murein DD-endopeptidase MepM/ murein hydrolase activator NlpD